MRAPIWEKALKFFLQVATFPIVVVAMAYLYYPDKILDWIGKREIRRMAGK